MTGNFPYARGLLAEFVVYCCQYRKECMEMCGGILAQKIAEANVIYRKTQHYGITWEECSNEREQV